MSVPIEEFRLNLSDLTFTGHDLVRPESVLALPDGTLWMGDGRGGLMRITPDGNQEFIDGIGHETNGLAMLPDGSILIAVLHEGMIKRRYADGRVEIFLEAVDGVQTTSANFVFVDSHDRVWISFSTRDPIWWSAVAQPRPDGYIVLVDAHGTRIVADGIHFPNEIRMDPHEAYLYVAETMGKRMLRYRVHADGSLGEAEVFGPADLGLAAYVDGFSFDVDGNIWVTTITRNGLGILTPAGDYHVVFEEPNESLLMTLQAKITDGTVQPSDLVSCAGPTLQLIASVTFAGPDRQTVYMGSLGMSKLPTFRSPVAGLPMRHWR